MIFLFLWLVLVAGQKGAGQSDQGGQLDQAYLYDQSAEGSFAETDQAQSNSNQSTDQQSGQTRSIAIPDQSGQQQYGKNSQQFGKNSQQFGKNNQQYGKNNQQYGKNNQQYGKTNLYGQNQRKGPLQRRPPLGYFTNPPKGKSTLTCPPGFTKSSDGQRCKNDGGYTCFLTPGIVPLCTNFKCPAGFQTGQDGKCTQGNNVCAMYGNFDMVRCYCAAGLTFRDGSCFLQNKPQCKLWGNSKLPKCLTQLPQATAGSCQSIINADVANADLGIIRQIPLSKYANDERLPSCQRECMTTPQCVAITLRFNSCNMYSQDPGGKQGFYWVSLDNKVYARCVQPANLSDVFIVNSEQGKYLSSDDKGPVSSTDGDTKERWTIKPAGQGEWTIQDYSQKYLSAKENTVQFSSTQTESELFQITKTPTGTVTIKGSNGYLSMNSEGSVVWTDNTPGTSEEWIITNTKFTKPTKTDNVPQNAYALTQAITPGQPYTPTQIGLPLQDQFKSSTTTLAGFYGTDLGTTKAANPAPATYVGSQAVSPLLAPFAFSAFFQPSPLWSTYPDGSLYKPAPARPIGPTYTYPQATPLPLYTPTRFDSTTFYLPKIPTTVLPSVSYYQPPLLKGKARHPA